MGPQGGGDGGREAERDLQQRTPPPHPLQALFTASRASCISWQRQQQKQQQQQQQWMQTTEKQCSSSVIKAQQLCLKSFHGQK